MTRKEQFNYNYNETKNANNITLYIKMPDGSTEIIINTNVANKVDYINKTYTDDLGHNSCADIKILNYHFNVLPTVLLSKREYDDLQDDVRWLSALECAGVDNWCGYSEAKDMLAEWDMEEE